MKKQDLFRFEEDGHGNHHYIKQKVQPASTSSGGWWFPKAAVITLLAFAAFKATQSASMSAPAAITMQPIRIPFWETFFGKVLMVAGIAGASIAAVIIALATALSIIKHGKNHMLVKMVLWVVKKAAAIRIPTFSLSFPAHSHGNPTRGSGKVAHSHVLPPCSHPSKDMPYEDLQKARLAMQLQELENAHSHVLPEELTTVPLHQN